MQSPPTPAAAAVTLRPPAPGDIGWIVARHGQLYAAEFGWDLGFEALVATIAGRLAQRLDPAREACWIAERGGERLGCVCLVQARDEGSDAPEAGVAQLRLLLVEPSARGLGLGRRLVRHCSDFARRADYRRIRLWTNSLLLAARGIYAAEGYILVGSESHHSFGQDLVGEIWELDLQ
ncbi:GNAT family N-acetyltransferase [Roseateles violae]|uniref:GNAT family N-acetyltransferase n=1 Tax=Roseateles violae TaxID=3058042 RepID=A0ABT8DWK1_9BURK|nr:GNAT family N-acetyltransferase [Pelomonas sp. PFR6]MDN3920699.1 GNAT family N-acetyltransferase [Pelomonas sp. PFR6]